MTRLQKKQSRETTEQKIVLRLRFSQNPSPFRDSGRRDAGSLRRRSGTSLESLHEGAVVVLDEGADVAHLLAGVLEDDARIVGLAPQAVGRHHHRQVVGVHLRLGRVLRLGEDLSRMEKRHTVSLERALLGLALKMSKSYPRA